MHIHFLQTSGSGLDGLRRIAHPVMSAAISVMIAAMIVG